MKPLQLPPNLIDHFYLGGQSIARLRGIEVSSARQPEEWLGATTHRDGDRQVGPSPTADGTRLVDLVEADRVGWTGQDSGAGGDVGVLLKLIDAGQRLPVHVHPDRSFAGSHLDCPYGKTEAWLVVGTSGPQPSVWVGFNQDVPAEELATRVDAQDSAWMLDHLNRLDVRPGDTVLVPAGAPHALGEGVFVVEVQEPTDFSILLEWSVTTVGPEDSHLGLGFATALSAVTRTALDADALADLVGHIDLEARSAEPINLLPPEAEPFFRMDLVAPVSDSAPQVGAGYAVVLALAGSGHLNAADGRDPGGIDVEQGQVWAVPAGFGPWRATGQVSLVVARPSRSAAAS